MKTKLILWSVFVLMVLAQLFVPAKMVWDREAILKTGKLYKFETAPVDPNDPFRGKYVTLRYRHTSVLVENDSIWERGEPVYVLLKIDPDGFAKIASISKEKPKAGVVYVKAKIGFISNYQKTKVDIDYPFDRFYMEEAKAPEAERAYNESNRDTTQTTYALVAIKDGEAVLQDVLIDGVSLKDLVN